MPRGAQLAAVCGLMRFFSVGCGARVGRVVVALVAPGVWLGGFGLLAFWFVLPSLQALRAETMVERFTARMHVCFASNLWRLRSVHG